MTFKRFKYTEHTGYRLDHYGRSVGMYGHDLHHFIVRAIREQHTPDGVLPDGRFRARVDRDLAVVYSAKGRTCTVEELERFRIHWLDAPLPGPPAKFPVATNFHPFLVAHLASLCKERGCTVQDFMLQVRIGIQAHHARATLVGERVQECPVFGVSFSGLTVYYTHDHNWIMVRGITDPANPHPADGFYGVEIEVPDYDAIESAMCENIRHASEAPAAA